MRRLASILVLATVGAGCGDPLVGADYRGEPILRITGQIESIGPTATAIAEGEQALVSMFWKTDPTSSSTTLLAQDSVSTGISFPSTFEVRIFDPPTSADLVQNDGRYGVGLLLVFVDKDGDRAFDKDEPVIGGNLSKAIIWASETIPAGESVFAAELPEGFSVVNQPFASCRPTDGEHHSPPQQGPHVNACHSDDDCPTDFTCDMQLRVCVPRDSFELEIGGDFDLRQARCPDR